LKTILVIRRWKFVFVMEINGSAKELDVNSDVAADVRQFLSGRRVVTRYFFYLVVYVLRSVCKIYEVYRDVELFHGSLSA